MGRGRAPCCAKVGLNRGSWTPEEDMRLIAYIHKYGHGNWRALPKLAGLLRCGKSCRLRWINYLRPDIKRGNFTKEEEDTVIRLHGLLGNKWSKIASCLPGRTDNEIKNVWNTHLKKRLAPKERKPTKEKNEEQPSSPSSITTASLSCSDEGDNKEQADKAADEETDQIEIPIELNQDIWDILADDHLSEPTHDMVLNSGDHDHPLVADLPELTIEPEIWSMIDDELDVSGRKESATSNVQTTTKNVEPESERWLAYLEQELDLWGDSTTAKTDHDHEHQEEGMMINFGDMEGGDPVASYFQTVPSSSSSSSPCPLDLIY